MTYEIIPLHHNAKNITGQSFGRLTAIAPVGRNCGVVWLCLCECSTEHEVTVANLMAGHIRSCGCIRVQLHTTHNMSTIPEYRIWGAMKSRCRNAKSSGYNRYGGRGINVCSRWDDFTAFISDMGRIPSSKHSIDRIDNDGDYCPENCRWATPEQQGRNKRNNRVLSFKGKTMCATDWADETGISIDNILNRLNALEWSIEKTLTEPVKHRNQASEI